MELLWFFKDVGLALAILVFLGVIKIVYRLWILPNMAYQKLTRSGLSGPSPSFPLGNIDDMVKSKTKRIQSDSSSSLLGIISHDIHSKVFPYFAQWQESHGKYYFIRLSVLYTLCLHGLEIYVMWWSNCDF